MTKRISRHGYKKGGSDRRVKRILRGKETGRVK